MHILLALLLSYIYHYYMYTTINTYISMYIPLFLAIASNSSNTSTCKALLIPIVYIWSIVCRYNVVCTK